MNGRDRLNEFDFIMIAVSPTSLPVNASNNAKTFYFFNLKLKDGMANFTDNKTSSRRIANRTTFLAIFP
jgi:hypothetical protein